MARLPAPLALLAVLTLAACQQPAATPAAQTGAEAAPLPVRSSAGRPTDAPPQEEAAATVDERSDEADTPCRDSLGEIASARLVARCIAVSPATRPPCNAQNPCRLIEDEIARSCAQFGPGDVPPECAG